MSLLARLHIAILATSVTLATSAAYAAKESVMSNEDSNWFAFTATSDNSPSVIGMEKWGAVPAGAHGFVQVKGKDLVCEDGTPIKFWGVNNCNMGCSPEYDDAARRAAHYRKYGINCVRMHKFTNPGGQGLGHEQFSVQFDSNKLDRFDHYMAMLRSSGIYFSWSAIYRHQFRPGDRERLIAPDEALGREHSIGLAMFAEDVQAIRIEMTTNLLTHLNPYSGLRYADDPALACVEFHNEDDIFFPTTLSAMEECPTYKARFCRKFSEWLREKYGSHEGLVKAWGAKAIDAYPQYMQDEHLDRSNIYPIAHHWFLSPKGLADQEESLGTKRRLLDTARFLYEVQMDFYTRFERAIRDTGYKGALVGSCWQAGDGAPHYYNLYTDYTIGVIDRHNYCGGQGGHRLVAGPMRNESMLAKPGSAIMSAGMQQVINRPFALSEWIEKIPTEWVAEGPALVAAYGMGLQGWDASFEFASDQPRFTPTIQSRTAYNVESPTQIGLYPALARMVLRGDVKEAEVVSVRKVCVENLIDGTLPFTEEVEQDGDVKGISGDVPPAALAVGRAVVEFTENLEETEPFDLSAHTKDGAIQSTTGQLAWHSDGENKGFFVLNSDATKAVVGFAPDAPLKLGDVTIKVDSLFAVVILTVMDEEGTIADADRLLLNVVARAKNSGMKFNDDHTEVLNVGQAPILLEPVRATIDTGRKGKAVVNILDHDGRSTGRSRPVKSGVFAIDGARDKALYYEVVFSRK